MQNEKATQHRLGIARNTLISISEDIGPDFCEDYMDAYYRLKYKAEDALDALYRDVDKKRRSLENARRKYIEKIAREVKKEVPE